MRKLVNQSGFTLIELLITITIIGILAGLAYPSYLSSVKRSNRSEAFSTLTDVAQRLQRCYTTYGKYDDPACGVYTTLNASSRMQSPGHQYYEITLDTVPSGKTTSNSFNLKANAVKAPQTKDTDCISLNLDQTGKKTAKDNSGADSTSKCW